MKLLTKTSRRPSRLTSFTGLSYDRELLSHEPLSLDKHSSVSVVENAALLDLPDRLFKTIEQIEGKGLNKRCIKVNGLPAKVI